MLCSQCGAQNADSAGVCAQCGQPLTAAPTAMTAVPVDGPTVYAGFWTRVGAAMIDILIIVVALALMSLTSLISILIPLAAIVFLVVYWIAYFVGPWLFTALFESGAMQATPGKKAVGIKVTDLQGNRISFGRATGRYFAGWLTNLTFYVGYVMVAFTQRRQSLHDLIAGTVVVAADATPAQVAAAPPVKPMSGWGIAGIFLLCLIPFFGFVGMLGAIAIPAYSDYTARSQVQEGLVIAQRFKSDVELFVGENGRWPANLADAGLEQDARDAVGGSRYLEDLEIANGTITLTYGRSDGDRIRDKRLSLRPYVNEAGDVRWLCGRAAEPLDAYFDLEDGGQASDRGITSLPDKYLPASCRAGAFDMEESP